MKRKDEITAVLIDRKGFEKRITIPKGAVKVIEQSCRYDSLVAYDPNRPLYRSGTYVTSRTFSLSGKRREGKGRGAVLEYTETNN